MDALFNKISEYENSKKEKETKDELCCIYKKIILNKETSEYLCISCGLVQEKDIPALRVYQTSILPDELTSYISGGGSYEDRINNQLQKYQNPYFNDRNMRLFKYYKEIDKICEKLDICDNYTINSIKYNIKDCYYYDQIKVRVGNIKGMFVYCFMKFFMDDEIYDFPIFNIFDVINEGIDENSDEYFEIRHYNNVVDKMEKLGKKGYYLNNNMLSVYNKLKKIIPKQVLINLIKTYDGCYKELKDENISNRTILLGCVFNIILKGENNKLANEVLCAYFNTSIMTIKKYNLLKKK